MTHRSKDVSDLSEQVLRNLNELSAKVSMARHAADSVQISITNDPEEPTGCLRSYRVNMTASTSTEISLIYAVDTQVRDLAAVCMNIFRITKNKAQTFLNSSSTGP